MLSLVASILLLVKPAEAEIQCGDGAVPLSPSRNENGVEAVDVRHVSAADRQAAAAAIKLPGGGWRASVATMLEYSSLSDPALRLVAEARPGLAWQAIRPDSRMWLDLLRRQSPREIAAFIEDRETLVIPWTGLPEAVRSHVVRYARIATPPSDAAEVRLAAPTLLDPWPVTFIRPQVWDNDELLLSGMIGFNERLSDRWLKDEASLWLRAPEQYACWTSLRRGPLAVHYSRFLVESELKDVIEEVELTLAENLLWLGHTTPIQPIDLYLYAARDSDHFSHVAQQTGYALPEHRQVHQVVNATPGHELAHILAEDAWGAAGTDAASEGLAIYRSGYFDQMYLDMLQIRSALCKRDVFASFDYRPNDYLLAGGWIAFLDARFGTAVVKEIYSSATPEDVLAEKVGRDASSQFCAWLGE